MKRNNIWKLKQIRIMQIGTSYAHDAASIGSTRAPQFAPSHAMRRQCQSASVYISVCFECVYNVFTHNHRLLSCVSDASEINSANFAVSILIIVLLCQHTGCVLLRARRSYHSLQTTTPSTNYQHQQAVNLHRFSFSFGCFRCGISALRKYHEHKFQTARSKVKFIGYNVYASKCGATTITQNTEKKKYI